jgi:hypothetical protein
MPASPEWIAEFKRLVQRGQQILAQIPDPDAVDKDNLAMMATVKMLFAEYEVVNDQIEKLFTDGLKG